MPEKKIMHFVMLMQFEPLTVFKPLTYFEPDMQASVF